MKTNENTKAAYLDADSPEALVALINDYLTKYSIIQIDYTHIEGRYGAYIIYDTTSIKKIEDTIYDQINLVK